MQGTILEYLERYGVWTLEEYAFSDVDSLILCQLSYLKFDGLVPDVRTRRPCVRIRDLCTHTQRSRLFADTRFARENRALFERVANSRRFGDMRLNCYINIVEKERQVQFSAVTFLLGNGIAYVAYRGTDETVIGWKEDFNMAFGAPVPGHGISVQYLHMVSGRVGGSLYVGGHSKGGNLAVYCAMKCHPAVRERIERIYSMDGPGMCGEILEREGYDAIRDRVVKILPRSSLIGMLFETAPCGRVVACKGLGLAQHDPFSWVVEAGDFVSVGDICRSSLVLDNTLNEWLGSLEGDKIRLLVETIYQIISSAQAEDLIAFTAERKKSMLGMIGAVRSLDADTMRSLKEAFTSLFELVGMRVWEDFLALVLLGKKKET